MMTSPWTIILTDSDEPGDVRWYLVYRTTGALYADGLAPDKATALEDVNLCLTSGGFRV